MSTTTKLRTRQGPVQGLLPGRSAKAKARMNDLEFRTPDGALVKYMVIEPALARVMLDANTRNRNVSHGQRDQYTRSMAADHWMFTGDSLKFGGDGKVLDGQHRLLACERSSRPFATLVVSDLPDEVQKVVDAGRKRSPADMLTLMGVADATKLTSVARLCLMWTNWRTAHTMITLGNDEVADYAVQNLGRLQTALEHSRPITQRIRHRVSATALAAAYMRAVEVSQDPFRVANIYHRLGSGVGFEDGDPFLALHSAFVNALRPNRNLQLYQVVRAWNAHARGEGLRKLQEPRGGLTVANFPDMLAPEDEDVSERRERELRAFEEWEDKRNAG